VVPEISPPGRRSGGGVLVTIGNVRVIVSEDNERVLQVVGFTVRAGLIVLTGAVAFTSGWPGPGWLAAQIVALAISVVLLAWWVLAVRNAPLRLRYAPLLPYGLAAMIIACGIASATRAGSVFNVLGSLAAFSAASDASPAAGYAITGLGIAATEVTGIAAGTGTEFMIKYPLVLVIGLAIGSNLRASRTQAEQSAVLLAQAGRLREEQAQVAALDERARIAREIHDVLAHSLGALGLQIQVARAVLAQRHDEEKADGILAQAQRMADDGLTETRRAIQALRGQTLPLPEGLAELCTDHELCHGTPVSFTVSGEPHPLSADAQVAIARTAQEALVNAAKHALGQLVEISLDYRGGSTALTVRNQLDGRATKGRDARFATANGGYGLAGMRERLLLLDGTLAAGTDGSEWVVTATVPQ
jgi:signal transduction histidine kinase